MWDCGKRTPLVHGNNLLSNETKLMIDEVKEGKQTHPTYTMNQKLAALQHGLLMTCSIITCSNHPSRCFIFLCITPSVDLWLHILFFIYHTFCILIDTCSRVSGGRETPPRDHTLSFCNDLGQVEYPTLWQLTSEDLDDIKNFYVPALVSFMKNY